MSQCGGVEVLVVGAGIVGVCAALRLAELGHEVLVFDRTGPAAEASGVNGGLIGGSTRAGIEGQLALGSLDLFTELQLQRGYPIGLRRCGGLQVIPNEAQLEPVLAGVTKQQEAGHQVQLLSPVESRAIEPALAEDIAGCVFRPLQGQAEPDAATRAFAAEAQRLGAMVETGIDVVSLARVGSGFRVGTRAGRVEQYWQCDTLLLAAGAWLAPLGQLTGINLPVVPVMGQMWAAAPGGQRLLHHVFTSTESALAWSSSGDDATSASVPDLTHIQGRRVTRHLYGRQTAAGEVVFGGDRRTQGWDKTHDPEGISVNKAHAAEILPFLTGCATVRTWAGLMPFSPDGQPIIGTLPGWEGLYVAGGLASSGFTRGPMTGRLVANMIHTGKTTPDLVALGPGRFN